MYWAYMLLIQWIIPQILDGTLREEPKSDGIALCFRAFSQLSRTYRSHEICPGFDPPGVDCALNVAGYLRHICDIGGLV